MASSRFLRNGDVWQRMDQDLASRRRYYKVTAVTGVTPLGKGGLFHFYNYFHAQIHPNSCNYRYPPSSPGVTGVTGVTFLLIPILIFPLSWVSSLSIVWRSKVSKLPCLVCFDSTPKLSCRILLTVPLYSVPNSIEWYSPGFFSSCTSLICSGNSNQNSLE